MNQGVNQQRTRKNETTKFMAEVDYHLKIEGPEIKGNSKADGHKDQIHISEFSFEEQTEGISDAGGERTAGKVRMADLVVRFVMCSASPQLFLHCANGEKLNTVTLYARKSGTGGKDYLTITMTDVLVSSYKFLGTGDEKVTNTVVPIDEAHLNFATIKYEFAPQEGNGLGAAVSAGWNKPLNKAL